MKTGIFLLCSLLKPAYKEWDLTHTKYSVNISYIKLAKPFHCSIVRVSYQAGSLKEIAHSNWVFEERAIKKTFIRLWEGFREANEGYCSTLGLVIAWSHYYP